VDRLPLAIGVDMEAVRIIDITALITFEETIKRARAKGIKVFFFNESPSIGASMVKFGIKNDRSTNDVYFDNIY
jgi:anti-anti-sigma regulatory factor